jgi:L-alanine-DL-glutamate epimerase-like enolase superfamily enzyme
MKIADVDVIPFRVPRRPFQDGMLLPARDSVQTVTRVVSDDGAEGFCLGGRGHGDQDGLTADDRAAVRLLGRSLLVGQHPFDRERFWQWAWSSAGTREHVLSVLDLALWDLQGRAFGVPVHKLLGGCRERVKAYASTFPNLGTPEAYAAHAVACRRRGYRAYKIHPYYFWDPAAGRPAPGRPSHVEHDLRVCRAVREAVGDGMVLMYDPWGTYVRYEEALRVGRALEELGFYWYEHPMPEYRVEPYVRLARELAIPILAPEVAAGSYFTRAEWILRGASDMSRIDVLRGGITGVVKAVAVCEAFGVRCEIHMSGFGNLQVLGATSEDTCEYYERGLEAPGYGPYGEDYDAPAPYLKEICDPLDADGYVAVPLAPGLGYVLDWDYINEHRLQEPD